MRRAALFLALLVGSIGCRPPKPIYVPCPEPPVVTMPGFEYPNLAPDASSRELLVALVRDWFRWQGYASQLSIHLDAYRKEQKP